MLDQNIDDSIMLQSVLGKGVWKMQTGTWMGRVWKQAFVMSVMKSCFP